MSQCGGCIIAGERVLRVKVGQLCEAKPAVQLPAVLHQALLAYTAARPSELAAEHAALSRISVTDQRASSPATGGGPAPAPRQQPAAESAATMADAAQPKNLAGLLEEVGYRATASPGAMQEVLKQVLTHH